MPKNDYKHAKADIDDGYVPVAKTLNIAISFLDSVSRLICDKITRASYGNRDFKSKQQRKQAKLALNDFAVSFDLDIADVKAAINALRQGHVIESNMPQDADDKQLYEFGIQTKFKLWVMPNFDATRVVKIFTRERKELFNRPSLKKSQVVKIPERPINILRNIIKENKLGIRPEIWILYEPQLIWLNSLDNDEEFARGALIYKDRVNTVVKYLNCGLDYLHPTSWDKQDLKALKAWFISRLNPDNTLAKNKSSVVDRRLMFKYKITSDELPYYRAMLLDYYLLHFLHDINLEKIFSRLCTGNDYFHETIDLALQDIIRLDPFIRHELIAMLGYRLNPFEKAIKFNAQQKQELIDTAIYAAEDSLPYNHGAKQLNIVKVEVSFNESVTLKVFDLFGVINNKQYTEKMTDAGPTLTATFNDQLTINAFITLSNKKTSLFESIVWHLQKNGGPGKVDGLEILAVDAGLRGGPLKKLRLVISPHASGDSSVSEKLTLILAYREAKKFYRIETFWTGVEGIRSCFISGLSVAPEGGVYKVPRRSPPFWYRCEQLPMRMANDQIEEAVKASNVPDVGLDLVAQAKLALEPKNPVRTSVDPFVAFLENATDLELQQTGWLPVCYSSAKQEYNFYGLEEDETVEDGMYRILWENHAEPYLSEYVKSFFDTAFVDKFLHYYENIAFYNSAETLRYRIWLAGFSKHSEYILKLCSKFGLTKVKKLYFDLYLNSDIALVNKKGFLDTYCHYLENTLLKQPIDDPEFNLMALEFQGTLYDKDGYTDPNRKKETLKEILLKEDSGFMGASGNWNMLYVDDKPDLTGFPEKYKTWVSFITFCTEVSKGDYEYLLLDSVRNKFFKALFAQELTDEFVKDFVNFYVLLKALNFVDIPKKYIGSNFPMFRNPLVLTQAVEELKTLVKTK